MTLTPAFLSDSALQDVLITLERAGYQAFCVGGCVRNALLGKGVDDIDIATSAPPSAVKDALGGTIACIPTGIEHGTITVLHHKKSFEITTFRKDVGTDGRHAVVAFGADMTEDASRRDFTMNALYLDARGSLYDPLDGMPDLLAQKVRFIGNARARIREDYLRILRFFRFTAHYGGDIDPEALAACAESLDGLAQLSRERIGKEVMKLLSAENPAPAAASMDHTGVLQAILPGADTKALPLVVHFESDLRLTPCAQLRLAAIAPQEVDLCETLRLSRADARQVSTLAAAARDTDQSGFALGHNLGEATARSAMILRAALLEQPPCFDGTTQGAGATFPLCAADLMPALSGPALGAALARAKAYWLRKEGLPDKAALIKHIAAP